MVTTGAIRCAKLQSNHHHQQTNTQSFTGRMPFLSPWWRHFDWSLARLTASIKFRMETFWYRLTQVHLEMAVKMMRERVDKL